MSRKIGFVFLLLGLLSTAAQSSFAQTPLQFGNNFFVTGDYAVAGAYGMNLTFNNGYTTGIITVPDVNPGIRGSEEVPEGAQIVDALLYWQTVEKSGTVPGQPGTGQNGFFRPLFKNGPSAGYPMTGVNVGSQNTVSWSQNGCSGTSTGKILRTYRAHVLDYLQQDANGNLIANGIYEVRLPSVGSPGPPFTLGASLVIIYRVLSPNVPLNSIVIYDGDFAPANAASSMTQTVQGFYDAAKNPVSKLTQIVGNGDADRYQTVYLNNVALPSLYSLFGQHLPSFPGYYGSWDNPTWTFGPNSNPANPVHEDNASATTQVVPNKNQHGCVSWGAVIVSTTAKNSDNDGMLDVWKVPPTSPNTPGYCDASVNEGVCRIGDTTDPAWVSLQGAKQGEKDVFVQVDYMCSSLIPNTGMCFSNTPYCSGSNLNPDGTCNTANGYSFDPRLTTDPNDGKSVIDKVVQAYEGNMGHTTHSPVVLHVIPIHGVDETDPNVTCSDNLGTVPPQLCTFPNQAGVVGWPSGLTFLKNELVDPFGNAQTCTSTPPPGNCMPRFQYGKKDSYHYALFGHALGLPNWTLQGGSLVSVVQSGHTVTFATSTPHKLGPSLNDPACAGGRVTVAFAITNSNLNGTYCVQVTSPTTFTIQATYSTNAVYTFSTDPNLSVASGQAGTVSGFSDIGGSNSLIALGSWGAAGATWQVKAGTFMHELGHSNGLTHGGLYYDNLANDPDDYTPTIEANCKSNVQSVMSYLFQVDLLDIGGPSNVPDYSEQTLATLNESTPETPTFLSGATYLSTQWYDTQSHGGSSHATLHCDGTPLLNTDVPMYLVQDPPNPLSWTTQQDINFDGKIEASLRGHDEWNGTTTMPGLDLRQIGATGSLTVAGGKGFQGGGGGKGFQGGGGGKGFSGGGGGLSELTVETANSVTRPPRNLTATEGVSARTINLNWNTPTFGQITKYKVYRSEAGAAFMLIASVTGNPPATTYTDTVNCDPAGFRYFVTAVILAGTPPQEQESVGSNIVPGPGQPALTGCYTNTPPTVALNNLAFTDTSSPNTPVQGDQIQITWSLQDDDTSTFVQRAAASTVLLAIGPIPSDTQCAGLAKPPAVLGFNGTYPYSVTTLSSTGGGVTLTVNQFAFNWDTTKYNAGCYFFELDLDSHQSETSTALTLLIYESDSNPHILNTVLPTATAGIPYAPNTIQESGGTGALTWSIIAGALPPGMSLDPHSGTVSGTATAAGTYNFTAKVVDSLGNFGTRAFTLKVLIFVSDAPPLAVAPYVTPNLPNATAAIPYANTLYETGAAPGNLTWSFTGTLPPGLSLGMNSGTVSGTPTTAGTYIFTAQVTDSAGNTGSLAFTQTVLIFVSDSIAPTITTTLPNATLGVPYMNTVDESGGVSNSATPFTWTIVPNSVMPGSGSTLPGISFQPNAIGVTNGTLSGNPNSTGTFTFKALVTDSAGNNGTQTLTLTIANAVVCTPPPSSLVSWYMLDANANDYQGINNGTVVGSGSQFVPAEVGNGFQPGPQGSGGIIVVPDSPTLALSQFTIGAWVKVNNLDNVEAMTIAFKGNSTGADVSTPYALALQGAKAPFLGNDTVIGNPAPGKVYALITNGTQAQIVFSNAVLNTGIFYHVAVTADGNTVNIYIDGQLDTSTPQLYATFASANPLQIGGIQGDSSAFDGVLDEVQIWQRALAAAEIQAIVNAGSAGECHSYEGTLFVANLGDGVNPNTGGNLSALGIDEGTGTLYGSPFATQLHFPFWITVDPTNRFVYAADGGAIDAYMINGTSLNAVPGSPFCLPAPNPCTVTTRTVAVDPTGGFVYAGDDLDNIYTFAINANTGALAPIAGLPLIQLGAGGSVYSLAFEATGRFAYAAKNAGGSTPGSVFAFSFNANTGALTPIAGSPFPAGKSPYVIAIDPSGTFAYVDNGADNTVSAYTIDGTTGALTPITGSPFVTGNGTAGTGVGPRSVTVDRRGQFALTANQGGDVSAYAIASTTGALSQVPGSPFPAGSQPVSVTEDITGRFVYVANGSSNNISAYTINRGTGALNSVSGSPFASGPFPASLVMSSACVAFPAGVVPFTTIFSIATDAAGDMFVVGGRPAGGLQAALQQVPLPNGVNTRFCSPVTLETNYTVSAYVPTAAERIGDFSTYPGLTLIDPQTNQQFPGNMIPPGRLDTIFAWRIPAHSANLARLSCSPEPTLHSIEGTVATSIQFVNNTAVPVNIYWINYQGQRVYYRGGPFATLGAGQSYVQGTFITHPWIVTDVTNNSCLGIWEPTESPGTTVITGSPSFVAPQSPTNLTAAVQGTPPATESVLLNWSAGAGNVVGYNVYRATAAAGPYTKLTAVPTANLTFTDTSVSSGQTYYYVVRAVDNNNVEGADSNEASATTP